MRSPSTNTARHRHDGGADPHPGPHQVLIRVEAAGMNPMDRSMAAGAWKERMPGSFPFVLGADLAGVVDAVGEGAGRFSPARMSASC